MSNLETISLKGHTVIMDKIINNILIYNDGEILFNCRRAEIQEFPSKFSWDQLSTITIEEVKLAKKLNLNRTDNFIIINKEHNYFNETRYDLYVNTKDIRVENRREEEYMKLDDRINFIPVADLYFTNGAEKVERNKNGIDIIKYDVNTPFTAKEGLISRHELTTLGKEVEELSQKFKELKIGIQSYYVKDLLKHFNVTERKEQ